MSHNLIIHHIWNTIDKHMMTDELVNCVTKRCMQGNHLNCAIVAMCFQVLLPPFKEHLQNYTVAQEENLKMWQWVWKPVWRSWQVVILPRAQLNIHYSNEGICMRSIIFYNKNKCVSVAERHRTRSSALLVRLLAQCPQLKAMRLSSTHHRGNVSCNPLEGTSEARSPLPFYWYIL